MLMNDDNARVILRSRARVGSLIYVLPSFDKGPVQYDFRKFLFRFVGPALSPDGMNKVHNIYTRIALFRLFQKSSLELTTLSSWLSR